MSLKKLPHKMYPGFGLSMLDRAVKEHFSLRCKTEDLQSISEYFEEANGLTCVYCGSDNPTRWDHLYPVSKGGDTVPGNLVPSCQPCDDSKQNKTLEEWFNSDSKKMPSGGRHENILREMRVYQNEYSYVPQTFGLKLGKLGKHQQQVYEGFKEKLDGLKQYLREHAIIN